MVSCPAKSCTLWSRSCIFITIVFLVAIMSLTKNEQSEMIVDRIHEKLTPLYKNGQGGGQKAATTGRQYPKRNPDASRHRIKFISPAFTEKEYIKTLFSKKRTWILFLIWQQTPSSVWEQKKKKPTKSEWECYLRLKVWFLGFSLDFLLLYISVFDLPLVIFRRDVFNQWAFLSISDI